MNSSGLHKLNLLLLQMAMKRVVSKPAPKHIMRTGQHARDVDFFTAEIRSLDGEYFDLQVDKITHDGFEGRSWDDSDGYKLKKTILFKDIGEVEFSATHFFGYHDFRYSSPLNFLIQQSMKFPWFFVCYHKLSQFWFNSKTPKRTDRYKLLEDLVAMRLDDDASAQPRQGRGVFEILAKVHGRRIISHPNLESEKAKMNLLLESLVDSNDVTTDGNQYRAAGQALTTIAKIEQENRHHREQMQHNKRIMWLTLVLAVVGLIQVIVN